jgi:Integrase core domain
LPRVIRVDQGTEFVSRDLDLWAYQRGVTIDFSRPGKPTDNAFIEAFNGRFRAECLNAHWFLSLADAQEKVENWRRYYNEERPHGQPGRRARYRCSITMAQPARHRDESGKSQLPAIQSWVSAQALSPWTLRWLYRNSTTNPTHSIWITWLDADWRGWRK